MNPIAKHPDWAIESPTLPSDLHDAIPLQATGTVERDGSVSLQVVLWLPSEGERDQMRLVLRDCDGAFPLALIGSDLHSVLCDEVDGKTLMLFIYGARAEHSLILCGSVEAGLLGESEMVALPWNPATGTYDR